MAVEADTEVVLTRPDGRVVARNVGDGCRIISVEPSRPDLYIHRAAIETNYDDRLIRAIVDAKGIAFLADEIARDQDPGYLERHLVATITGYIDPAELAGRTVLDFGCGAGASTTILARLLPDTDIIGVELSTAYLDAARERARFHDLTRVNFELSPAGDQLPASLTQYDAVVLSAVFEHLLPAERRTLMPRIWDLVKPNGYLFIDETPWRWFPIESHTTGIPLLNYAPDRLARELAGRKPKLQGRDSWPELLRAGIRGGTVREIRRSLGPRYRYAETLRPSRNGIDNWVDLWFEGYARGQSGRFRGLKRSARGALKGMYRTTGVAAVPYLSLAFRKGPPA